MFWKYSVSIMDNSWDMIIPKLKVKYIPRSGELIFLEKTGYYYKVLNVIHNIDNNYGIFIIVDIYDKKT